jgi:hypothetical protein
MKLAEDFCIRAYRRDEASELKAFVGDASHQIAVASDLVPKLPVPPEKPVAFSTGQALHAWKFEPNAAIAAHFAKLLREAKGQFPATGAGIGRPLVPFDFRSTKTLTSARKEALGETKVPKADVTEHLAKVLAIAFGEAKERMPAHSAGIGHGIDAIEVVLNGNSAWSAWSKLSQEGANAKIVFASVGLGAALVTLLGSHIPHWHAIAPYVHDVSIFAKVCDEFLELSAKRAV